MCFPFCFCFSFLCFFFFFPQQEVSVCDSWLLGEWLSSCHCFQGYKGGICCLFDLPKSKVPEVGWGPSSHPEDKSWGESVYHGAHPAHVRGSVSVTSADHAVPCASGYALVTTQEVKAFRRRNMQSGFLSFLECSPHTPLSPYTHPSHAHIDRCHVSLHRRYTYPPQPFVPTVQIWAPSNVHNGHTYASAQKTL